MEAACSAFSLAWSAAFDELSTAFTIISYAWAAWGRFYEAFPAVIYG
jgi:hypothetical protein